jgi:hypothetical protein
MHHDDAPRHRLARSVYVPTAGALAAPRALVHTFARTFVHAVANTLALVFVALPMLACSSSSATLSDMTYPGSPPLVSDAPQATVPEGSCPGSLRTVRSGPDVYGAWWEVRDDSSAVLMVGRSTDGGRGWSIAQPGDTLDRSRRGCARPAPAIAADSAINYVDIAYFLEAREGPGVFFTHSMDARHLGTGDGIFHAPVPVIYGTTPARVSVSVAGDRVAVAYEDPNAERPMVGLALSRTMGHIFEQRFLISLPNLPAHDPTVALRGDSVITQWWERTDTMQTGGRVATRSARW